MKYKITYERRTAKNLSFYKYATEIIEVKGIMHAHKLAATHLKELRKQSPHELRIYTVFLREN